MLYLYLSSRYDFPRSPAEGLPPCQPRRWFEADDPPLLADGRAVVAGVPGVPAVSATRRYRQSKRVAEIAENAGIDGNEVLKCSPVTGKSLAETAETPCKYFAREFVRSFTVSLWGAVQTRGRNAIPTLRQMCPRRSHEVGRWPK